MSPLSPSNMACHADARQAVSFPRQNKQENYCCHLSVNMIASCISNLSDFRMSLFDSSSSEAELSKLHNADHNMNSSASTEGRHSAFPFPAFPQFPFLPIPGLSQESLPTVPLSLNLTGQLEEASPKSAESESPKSSPTGNIDIYIL